MNEKKEGRGRGVAIGWTNERDGTEIRK